MSLRQLRDWYRVRPGYWFRPKVYGWGVVPVTWQGWGVTALFTGLAIAVARLAGDTHPAYLAALLPVIGVYLLIARARTDGDLTWHWGTKE